MATVTVTAANSSPPPPAAIDPCSGFCAATKTFHSLRPSIPLPLSSQPLSFASYAFSHLPSPLPTNPAFISSATGATISYPDFLARVDTLASSLRCHLRLSNGHVAFILSPATLDVPILYFALLSIGVIVCPANPASTPAEISRQVALVAPSVAFAVSSTAANLPRGIPTILLDSPQFRSLAAGEPTAPPLPPAAVRQSDTAAIQFSSGTTGRLKAAAVSHRSYIAMTAANLALKAETAAAGTTMLTAPLFHSMGFFMALNGVAMRKTTVVVGRCGLPELLRAAERYQATELLAAPPLVVAMTRSEEAAGFCLAELKRVICGGAPLPEQAAERFSKRFPGVELMLAYGLTEAGGISLTIGPEECRHLKSVGRLAKYVEARITDTITGETLTRNQQGELWVRGPTIMTSYIGDQEENAITFSSDGWLKTGDLCYFNHDGYLFIVDRLKEMIKYKAYQVSPVELEHLLQTLPEIVDVAVIPYSHEEVGQIPMALVVRQPGSKISEDEIINFISKQVAPYKKIRRVAFVNSIPKSPAGKILRRELASLVNCGSISSL